jgi:hypothetical protein
VVVVVLLVRAGRGLAEGPVGGFLPPTTLCKRRDLELTAPPMEVLDLELLKVPWDL